MNNYLMIAKKMQIQLRNEIQIEKGKKYAGFEVVAAIIEKFSTNKKPNCKNSNTEKGISSCGCRCNVSYWDEHSAITKTLLENFAEKIGESKEMYGLAGKIHDLDYLKYPHDTQDNESLSGCHPLPLVKFLIKYDVDPEISLAVLEHAPHLQLGNTTRLSLALSACEELATLISFNNKELLSGISELAKAISKNINPTIVVDSNIDGEPRVFSSVDNQINKPLKIAYEYTKDGKLN